MHYVLGKIIYGGLKHNSLYLGLVLPSGLVTEPHFKTIFVQFYTVLKWNIQQLYIKKQMLGTILSTEEHIFMQFENKVIEDSSE